MGRRRGVRVPEELGVVVGVGVDEAGAHNPVGGINRLDGLGFGQVANPGSPEPSTTMPPRMSRSYMGARLAVGWDLYLTERQVFGAR